MKVFVTQTHQSQVRSIDRGYIQDQRVLDLPMQQE
jgi:hypothetical protein